MDLTGMKALAPATEASTPLSLPRTARPAIARSETAEEIKLYWTMKRMIEEDHLTAANKAVARIRAKALKEEDYRKFEESLKETLDDAKKEGRTEINHGDEMETWIRSRWTKSKFSYLNQPTSKCSCKTSKYFYIHSTVYLHQQLLYSCTILLHIIQGFRRKITGSSRHCDALAKH